MERLELLEQGWSKLRAQPWLTVIACDVSTVFCRRLWHRPTQHKQSGPRRRVDVVHLLTLCGLLPDFLQTSCLCVIP